MCRVGGAKRGKARSLPPGVHRGHPLCLVSRGRSPLCWVQGRSPLVSTKWSERSVLLSRDVPYQPYEARESQKEPERARGANGLADSHSPLADWVYSLADWIVIVS